MEVGGSALAEIGQCLGDWFKGTMQIRNYTAYRVPTCSLCCYTSDIPRIESLKICLYGILSSFSASLVSVFRVFVENAIRPFPSPGEHSGTGVCSSPQPNPTCAMQTQDLQACLQSRPGPNTLQPLQPGRSLSKAIPPHM